MSYYCGLPPFPVLQYMEHRLMHLPVVYTQCHKQHHYLHDTTPFDAGGQATALNEEPFWLLADVLPCLLAATLGCPDVIIPVSLSMPFMLVDLLGEKGVHTRTASNLKDLLGDLDGDNFHADHHTLHMANFSLLKGQVLDFYFGTQGLRTTGSHGRTFRFCQPEELQSEAADAEGWALARGAAAGQLVLCIDQHHGEGRRSSTLQ